MYSSMYSYLKSSKTAVGIDASEKTGLVQLRH